MTRRPLELRLNHQSEGSQPWAEFSIEDKGNKYTDMNKVQAKIIQLTDEVTNDEEPSVITSKIDIAEGEKEYFNQDRDCNYVGWLAKCATE